jgi:hypothetical protein
VRVPALAVAAALAFGCAFPAAKSRIEPHERVLIELRSEDAALAVPGSGVDPGEIDTRFQAAIKRELVRRRSLAPNRSRADAVLAVRLIGISLQDKADANAALRITAAARVETGGEDPAKPRGPWQATEYEGPARPRSEWDAADGKMLDEQLELGLAQVADELVASAIRSKEAMEK